MSKRYIYMVADVTDEDQFFPMGFHLKRSDAIADANNSGENDNLEHQDEVGEIEVRRFVGGGGAGYRIIFSRRWERDEDYEWKGKTI